MRWIYPKTKKKNVLCNTHPLKGSTTTQGKRIKKKKEKKKELNNKKSHKVCTNNRMSKDKKKNKYSHGPWPLVKKTYTHAKASFCLGGTPGPNSNLHS